MNDPFATDWRAIGLPDPSPFDVLRNPSREATMTPEQIAQSERNAKLAKAWRDKQAAKKAGVPSDAIKRSQSTMEKMKRAATRVNKHDHYIGKTSETQRDKTAKITGNGTPESRDK